MRARLTKPQSARKGDLVVVSLRLPSSQSDARLSLWSATRGYDMSPHIQQDVLGVLIRGKPGMHKPMYVRLSKQLRKAVWQFTADEDLEFVVIQDVDDADEPRAQARIRAYGKVGQTIRRIVHYGVRALRRGSQARVSKAA